MTKASDARIARREEEEAANSIDLDQAGFVVELEGPRKGQPARRPEVDPETEKQSTEAWSMLDAMASVLFFPAPGRALALSENLARFKLGNRIVNGGRVELTSDERTLIKTAACERFGAGVVGQIDNFLEGRARGG